MPANTTPAYALAKVWATMDGKLDAFLAEEFGSVTPNQPGFTGHFDGYMAEAEHMLEELEAVGFRLLPIGR